MKLDGEEVIAAPRARVWEALNDPEVLKACITGCESLEKTSDTSFEATVMAKVGPVRARFNGAVTLSELDPPNGYRIAGEGKGGAAGFAKGGARITLSEADGDATRLTYEVEAQVGGKLAQIGSRLVDAAAKKYAGEFFEQFNARIGAPADAPEPAPEAAGAQAEAASKGVPTAVWAGALIVAVGALLYYLLAG